jgi:hypothetical protein
MSLAPHTCTANKSWWGLVHIIVDLTKVSPELVGLSLLRLVDLGVLAATGNESIGNGIAIAPSLKECCRKDNGQMFPLIGLDATGHVLKLS